ncbi:glycogen-binding domain-containing protein [Thermospira aquatica]|uniref:Glycogen-binding domain-containing protein n=1 Tax=Thermospira aquatica TaxID=2828656 RepID=A0AAX3BFG1_9SPIR|nr:glycogen-binding domain-containing protein [Thermospira aquatica]URA10306.1 glycogen-binding domain-containing protein [Thermospira aquatica]
MRRWWLVWVCFFLIGCGETTVNLPRAKGVVGRYAPRVVRNEVTFSLYAPEAEMVNIAGTFNGWNPDSTPMVRGEDGVWRVTLPLVYGRQYMYKFIVDGFWIADPDNPSVVPDEYGGLNSIIYVKEK